MFVETRHIGVCRAASPQAACVWEGAQATEANVVMSHYGRTATGRQVRVARAQREILAMGAKDARSHDKS